MKRSLRTKEFSLYVHWPDDRWTFCSPCRLPSKEKRKVFFSRKTQEEERMTCKFVIHSTQKFSMNFTLLLFSEREKTQLMTLDICVFLSVCNCMYCLCPCAKRNCISSNEILYHLLMKKTKNFKINWTAVVTCELVKSSIFNFIVRFLTRNKFHFLFWFANGNEHYNYNYPTMKLAKCSKKDWQEEKFWTKFSEKKIKLKNDWNRVKKTSKKIRFGLPCSDEKCRIKITVNALSKLITSRKIFHFMNLYFLNGGVDRFPMQMRGERKANHL